MNKSFDIFISFKATDKGAVTPDVAVASELYHALTGCGFNVFFSSETISGGGSSDFSHEIDSALDSASLLIVVSSSLEYINSRWVEYEWKTFNADILSNIKPDAQIVTFTDGLDTRELPRILRYVQNYNYSDSEGLLTFVHSFFHREKTASAPILAQAAKQQPKANSEHNSYNSAGSGEFEILRLRAGRSYALDMKAIEFVKSKLGRKKYNVIVLGCAYGFVAETRFGLDDDIENVICIDKNEEVLVKARELYKNYPHMKFYCADLQTGDYVKTVGEIFRELGISGADIIFTTDLFRYLNNPGAVIRSSRKLLNKDGMLIIRDCDDSNKMAHPDEDGALDKILSLCRSTEGMPNYYIGREMPLIIRNGGFNISDVRLDIHTTLNMSYEEKEEFFFTTFGSRKSIARQMAERNPAERSTVEELIAAIDSFEENFYDMNFWYSESNLIFIAGRE